MNYSLFFRTEAYLLCLLLFVGCILMVIFGRYARAKFFQHDQQESKGGVNSLLGALFGLWGFLLAFTFGNSASRYEAVRAITVEESNVVRNAILRAKVFPDSIRNEMNEELKIYLQSLIDYYVYVRDFEKFLKARETAETAGQRLWEKTINASRQANLTAPTTQMFASLTLMLDINSRRDALLRAGVPELIVYALFFLALTISFIGGFTTPVIKTKEWIVVAGFLLLACSIIYITLDLGRPLRGFIQPNSGKDGLIELQKKL